MWWKPNSIRTVNIELKRMEKDIRSKINDQIPRSVEYGFLIEGTVSSIPALMAFLDDYVVRNSGFYSLLLEDHSVPGRPRILVLSRHRSYPAGANMDRLYSRECIDRVKAWVQGWNSSGLFPKQGVRVTSDRAREMHPDCVAIIEPLYSEKNKHFSLDVE